MNSVNPNLKTDLLKSKGFTYKKPEPLQDLLDEAWKWFSIFIRLRKANWKGQSQCVTCRRWIYWKLGDAGHFLPGRHASILFDERGTNFQCRYCNRNLGGNPKKYKEFMLKKYGAGIVGELIRQNQIVIPFMPQELKALTGKYKAKAQNLLKKYG